MLAELLTNNKFVFYDGALGTMLQRHGLEIGKRPEIMNITAHETVEMIHKMYFEAGSDIVCTNTFGASAHGLKNIGYSPQQVITAAVQAARHAAESSSGDKKPVALDIGPIGEMLEPSGELSFEEAYEMFKEMAVIGENAGADLAAIETMSDLEEVRAAILAIKENTSLPIFATMTFEKSGFTYMGCTPEKFAGTAKELGVAAVGLNCSLEPRQMYDIIRRMADSTDLPLIVKPNAGLPDAVSGRYDVGPEEFTEQMLPYAQMGVKVVGGCCGTTPEHIKALKRAFIGK